MVTLDHVTTPPTLDLDHALAALAGHGLVVTRQRRAILHALYGAPQHPTAAQIHAAVQPDVTLATVYNTLALLRELELVQELPQVGGQARFDCNAAPHHHLHCTTCGALHDLPLDAVQVVVTDPSVRAAGVQVTVFGVCPQGC